MLTNAPRLEPRRPAVDVQNIRLLRDDAAGTSGGDYAAITFVGVNPVTAVIMVAGDNANETSSLRDNHRQQIAL